MRLSQQNLLQNKSFINNEWVSEQSGKTFEVTNPATGDVITRVANCTPKETEQAIEAATKAFEVWRKKTAKERSAIMRKWFNLVNDSRNDLALLMTTEQGKPLAEAKGEITYGASFIEWFAEEARRVYGDVIPTPLNDRRIVVIKQPIGVVAAITPWNFPISMITRKISPAIAAGCTVVLKPAAQTPLSALALAYLSKEAGFPDGVINIITSDNAAEIGKVMTEHPLVQKFSFTGSTGVGKMLMQQCASTVKKVSLELGGNAPLIVFDDANIQQAVKGALASKYRNAGQTCVCANRIYVQDQIYNQFIQEYKKAVTSLKVGEGTQPGVEIGPLIDEKAIEKINRLVHEAVGKGAEITTGGNNHMAGKLFFQPTIVENCNQEMALSKEEIFGPVSAIYKFDTEEEAIRFANDTEYGLASYFFTQNLARAWRVAEALDYGIVGINEGVVSHAEAPFGGMKESGIGREGSKYGIEEYVEIKYLCLGGM
ncbi:NAD-dependent succinate-semialdehyde dehydrogenase [Segetibacter koreensis]|uniref:NAD-dependent succinate-semialdehyde dehydrogenase n=1 Tax=Segetibacter koreensis TaxID=398037 RepID=UPI000361F4DA|nr:NAD-dependent succinate-semialdehyde dehydrogenase [Segetibacter koreensis]